LQLILEKRGSCKRSIIGLTTIPGEEEKSEVLSPGLLLYKGSYTMRGTIFTQLIFIAGALTLWFACSHQTARDIPQNEYLEAIQPAEERVRENPDDDEAIQELGVLYFKSGQFDKAIPVLEKADQLKTSDPRTSCYLGLSYEMSGQLDPAMATFLRYLQLADESPYRRWLKGRHNLLIRKKMKDEIAALVFREAAADSDFIAEKTVMVLPFNYHGKDLKYSFLGKGLQSLIIDDLKLVEKISVIDRLSLQMLLDEIAQKESLLQKVENRTAWIANKMNARTILKGAYNIIDDRQLILDIAHWDLASEEFPNTNTIPDSLSNLFKLQKEIVYNLLNKVNVEPSPNLHDRISKRTVNDLPALIAFSAGLAKEDAGEYREAVIFYRKSLELSPKFQTCIEKIETNICLAMALRDPDRAIKNENFARINQGI
jgi:tetratricopeptide (TPR) repeat protein